MKGGKALTVKLRASEVKHLLALLELNERDGSYYGPRQEWKIRAGRITARLHEAFDLGRSDR